MKTMAVLVVISLFLVSGAFADQQQSARVPVPRHLDLSRQALFRMFVIEQSVRPPLRPLYESGVTLYTSKPLALRFLPLAPPLRVSSTPGANVMINPPVDPFVLTHTFP